MPKSAAGFTLVTVLIGIMIFGILFSLTLANLSFLDQMVVRTELNVLYATICYAQQVAQVQGRPCAIHCDPEHALYSCQDRRRELPRSVIFGVKPGLQGPPSSPQNPVAHPVTFKKGCIHVAEQGTVSAGTLYLIDRNFRYQYALSSAVTHIPYIRLYRYDTQWNMLE